MKTKTLLTALALACSLNSAFATNEIRMQAPVKYVSPGEWVATTPLIGSPQVVSTVCGNWTPDPDTIVKDTSFEQSRSCDVTSSQSTQQRERFTKTGEIRNVGEPILKTSIQTNQESQQAIGSKVVSGSFLIQNPVAGRSGIYTVKNGSSTFSAYVDMTTDGGKWVLIGHWAAPPSTLKITFNNVVVKNNAMTTYTDDSVNFPVVPSGTINTADTALLIDSNPGWAALYGPWVRFSTFAPNNIQDSTGFTVMGGDGSAHTVYHQRLAWYPTAGMDETFGMWTVPGNYGPCGGANKVGSDHICPVFSGDPGFGPHADISSPRSLYVKGN
jgi:hypothetical protein